MFDWLDWDSVRSFWESVRGLVKEAIVATQYGLVGAGGGLVGYLIKIVHFGEEWSWAVLLVMYIAAPFLMGHVIEDFWPRNDTGARYPGMGGTIAILGTAGGVVLVAAQESALKIFKKTLNKAEKAAE